MNSNEDYLDELLKAIEPITNSGAASEEVIEEPETEVSVIDDDDEIPVAEEKKAQLPDMQQDVSTAEEYQSMTEEEIDALINEAKAAAPQKSVDSEETDIADILEQYSGDENVDDIQELLKKDDNREVVDANILLPEDEDVSETEADTEAFDEGQQEIEHSVDEKTKKPRREKRKKREKEEKPEEESTNLAEKEKKPNIFQRVLKMLTEEDESLDEEKENVPEAAETGITDENLNILNELSREDKKKEKKKEKGRKKKGKEEKKPGEEGETEAEDKADNKKGKKEKKPKRKKKTKKEKPQEPATKEKKLSKKKVIATFAFCLTIMAVIIIMSTVFNDLHSKAEARWAFDNEDFQSCYENLYGKKLSEADQVIYEKSELVLAMNRKLSSYENFKKLGMNVEALNALFEGAKLHDRIAEKAADLGITDRIETIYQNLYSKFAEYGLSDDDVSEILAYENAITYTKRLDSIVNGTPFEPDKAEMTTEAVPLENVLPEEEDFLPNDNIIGQDSAASETQQETGDTQGGTDEAASEETDDAVRVGSQSNNGNTGRQGTQVGDGSMNMEAPVKNGEAVLER